MRRVLIVAVALLAVGCSSHSAMPSPSNVSDVGLNVIQKQPLDMGWATKRITGSPYDPLTVGSKVYFLDNGLAFGSATMGFDIKYYQFDNEMQGSWSLALGPDGNLWAGGDGYIARVVPGGAETDFAIQGGGLVVGIVDGPDKAMWFTDCPMQGVCEVGRITTSGLVTLYPVNGVNLQQITDGPDGNLWIADQDAIHKMTTSGADTVYQTNLVATYISTGSDGALYFCGTGIGTFGRITTDGTVSYINLPEESSASITGLTLGPANALWLVVKNGVYGIQIYYPMTNSFGTFIPAPVIGGSQAVIFNITAGPDGNVWAVGGAQHAAIMVYVRLAMAVSPSSLTLSSGSMGTLTVSEKVYKGGWTAASSSKAIATVAPASADSFTVTAVAPGTCDVTIFDNHGNSIPVTVIVQ